MNKPTNNLISVIIPCYKQAHYLQECIASLQAQSYPNWEAIIVNDGSPDNTAIIAKELCAIDERVHYFEKPNGGLSSARNSGLKIANGNWIQFLDADDLLLPEKFSAHLELLKGMSEHSITYTNVLFGRCDKPHEQIDGWTLGNNLKLETPLYDFAVRWEHSFSIPIHAALFPSSLLNKIKPVFDESLPNHEDWDMWMRIVPEADSVTCIPSIHAIYRMCHGTMSRQPDLMWQGFRSAIRKQRRSNKNNIKLQVYLLGLSYRNDFRYGKHIAYFMRPLSLTTWFRRLPWPLQRLIRGRTSLLGWPSHED